MSEESQHPSIGPELEARIVALVLGEASDFEREELERLIAQWPELAAFRLEMQYVHGLLQDVGAGESVDEDEDWKLSADRRNLVQAVFRGEATIQPAIQEVPQPAQPRMTFFRSLRWNVATVAAVLCITGFVGIVMLPSFFTRESMLADRRYVWDLTRNVSPAATSTQPLNIEQPWSGGTDFYHTMDAEMSVAATEHAGREFARMYTIPQQTSEAALSAIQDTLGADAKLWDRRTGVADDTESVAANAGIQLGKELGQLPEAGGAPATNEEGPVSAPPPAADVALIVENGMAWSVRGRKDGDQNDDDLVAAQSSAPFTPGGEVTLSPVDADIHFNVPGARTAEPALGTEDQELGLLRGSDISRSGRSAGDTAAGHGRFGGRSSGLGVNQPPSEADWDKPAEGKDTLSGETESLARFEDSKRQPLDRLGVPRKEDLTGPQSVNRGFGMGIPDAPGEANAPQTRTSEPVTLSGTFGKQANVPGAGEDAGETEQLRDRGGVQSSGGVTFFDSGVRLKQELSDRAAATAPESLQAGEPVQDLIKYAPPALVEGLDLMTRVAPPTVAPPAGLNETTAAEAAFSTFSLHVSDVSFKLARAAFARGEWPDAATIRIEEFVNAFDYGDPLPSHNEKVACLAEQSIHPFLQQRNLLRISLRTAATGRSVNTPLRLTFLLDNSGSMERPDRRQTVRRAFALLAQQLTPIDQVTLISFAHQPRLVADSVSGAEAGQLVRLIDELPSEGGTNIEAALQLAFEKAQEQQTSDAGNCIILLTDGAVNLGDANPESLSRIVTTMRGAGIAFDAAGISAEGLNDDVLEALTRKGDGRYYLLDSVESADEGFARQIAGALHPSAKNVKVQVEFNPKRVGKYKLLGFEKHILKQEDFRNDQVDAAELTAEEAGVALYQFEARPDGEGDVGSVSVRFRDLTTGQMIENRWPIPYEADAPRPDEAAPSLRIAASAALLAAKLRGEPLGETVDLQTLSHLISGLPEQPRSDPRVQQLKLMIEQARQMTGNQD